MPLLDNSNPTLSEKQDLTKKRLVNSMRSLFATMRQVYEMNFAQVWYNNEGLLPQQVFDAFTNEAVEFFSLALALYNFINTIQPGALDLPAPFPIVPNANGTITVITDRSSSSTVSSSSFSSHSSESLSSESSVGHSEESDGKSSESSGEFVPPENSSSSSAIPGVND